MIFHETDLAGVVVVEMQLLCDERGFFARSWCEREFSEHSLNPKLVQCSISFNKERGTLRGVHHQAAPNPEAKLVRCTRGSLYDVALDLRPDSVTYLKWTAAELTAENHREFYHPDAARGVRWNDPAFGIEWPGKVEVISERDRTYPDFESR